MIQLLSSFMSERIIAGYSCVIRMDPSFPTYKSPKLPKPIAIECFSIAIECFLIRLQEKTKNKLKVFSHLVLGASL
jgi:hypothetical protein